MQVQRSEGEAWREKQHQETEMKLNAILTGEQMKKVRTLKKQRANNKERPHPRSF